MKKEAKIILFTLLMVTYSYLNCMKLEFVNGQALEGQLIRSTEKSIYFENDKVLLIIDPNLVKTEIPSTEGKLNFNSYDEVVEINSRVDLNKLLEAESSLKKKKNNVAAGGKHFLFWECSSGLGGLGFGGNYELAFCPFGTISLGYSKGTSFQFFFLSAYEREYFSVPLALRLGAKFDSPISPELGFAVEYVKWKNYEQSIFGTDRVLVDKGEEFMPSILAGICYLPPSSGLAMKSGVKVHINQSEIGGVGLYLDLGFRF